MNNYEVFQEKFGIEQNIIFQTKYWNWSLRPLQPVVGSGILSANFPVERMSDLPVEAGEDLIKMMKIIENTLKKAVGMELMNYVMLMLVDHHVHYHVIPRFSGKVTINGKTFTDEFWCKPVVLDSGKYSKEELEDIKNYIKDNLVV